MYTGVIGKLATGIPGKQVECCIYIYMKEAIMSGDKRRPSAAEWSVTTAGEKCTSCMELTAR